MNAYSGTAVFDGYAWFSVRGVADQFEAALTSVASDMPVMLFPARHGNDVQIGLFETDADAFTKAFGRALRAELTWTQVFKGRREMIFAGPKGYEVRLTAFFYYENGAKFDSRDGTNPMLRHIHGTTRKTLRKNGLHRVGDILGGAAVGRQPTPVDVVFTWVNHDDPAWRALYAEATSGQDAASDAKADAMSLSRFFNREELRYAIRSVEQYLPWVQRIFVLSNCAPPEWLSSSDRIRWVRHDAVIPVRHLPTFNSHAIEASLHLIPDLSETFLYFNDDFFINAPLPREAFFAPNDVPNANLEAYGVVNGDPEETDKDHLNAARNGVALLQDSLGATPTRLHKHAPYALRKSFLFEIEKHYRDAIECTRAATFRSLSDVSVASFLFHHYAYATGRGTQTAYPTFLLKNTRTDWRGDLARLKADEEVGVFCINDGGRSHDADSWNKSISEFLAWRFPVPFAEETPTKS